MIKQQKNKILLITFEILDALEIEGQIQLDLVQRMRKILDKMYQEESSSIFKFKRHYLLAASLVAYMLELQSLGSFLEKIKLNVRKSTLRKLIAIYQNFDGCNVNLTNQLKQSVIVNIFEVLIKAGVYKPEEVSIQLQEKFHEIFNKIEPIIQGEHPKTIAATILYKTVHQVDIKLILDILNVKFISIQRFQKKLTEQKIEF